MAGFGALGYKRMKLTRTPEVYTCDGFVRGKNYVRREYDTNPPSEGANWARPERKLRTRKVTGPKRTTTKIRGRQQSINERPKHRTNHAIT